MCLGTVRICAQDCKNQCRHGNQTVATACLPRRSNGIKPLKQAVNRDMTASVSNRLRRVAGIRSVLRTPLSSIYISVVCVRTFVFGGESKLLMDGSTCNMCF